MLRPTPAWTDQRGRTAVLVGIVCAGSLAGLTEDPPIPVWVATALVLAVVAALALDVWGGLLAGLGAASLLVAVRQATGHWSSADFFPALVETLALLGASTWAGFTGQPSRPAGRELQPNPPQDSRYVDLGLLSSAAARARLDEEVVARSRDGAPLGLALIELSLVVEDRSGALKESLGRSLARLVESRTGRLDVPFALSADTLGVIFPHVDDTVVWDTVGGILEAVRTTRATIGPDSRSVALTDVATIRVGVSELSAATVSVDSLMAEARAALEVALRGDGP